MPTFDVQFTDASSGNIQSRHWDFGDGNTSTLTSPLHTYAASGTYNVTLTVYGYFGTSSAQTQVVSRYLLDIEFSTADAPPITVYTGEYGSITYADPTDIYTVAAGETVPISGSGSVANGNPQIYSASFSRVVGRLLVARLKRVQAFGSDNRGMRFVWADVLANTNEYGLAFAASGGDTLSSVALAQVLSLGDTLAADTYGVISILLTNPGYQMYLNGNLIWVSYLGSEASLLTNFYAISTGRRLMGADYWRVLDMLAPFKTNLGIAVVDVASPTPGATVTSTADGMDEVDIIAPTPLAGTAGFFFHFASVTDCNRVYTDSTSGRLRLDTIAGGVATNRISVNSVFVDGATIKCRVIHTGSLMDLYSFAANVPTKRGGQINVSNQNTVADVSVEVAVGLYTYANLRGFARTLAAYSVLDGG